MPLGNSGSVFGASFDCPGVAGESGRDVVAEFDDGVSVNGSGFGGGGPVPNNEGGVLGRGTKIGTGGIAGDAERAFLGPEGEGSPSSLSSSNSTSTILSYFSFAAATGIDR